MFTKAIFVASALLSIVSAVPLQQHHKHHQRDYIYETKTISEVTTIDVTTTIWLEAGETPPANYGAPAQVTSHIKQTVTVPAASPASPSSPPEYSPDTSYVAPSPSSPAAPTTSAWVAPTSQAPAPAPQPSEAPSSNPPSSGGSAPSGQTYTGDITYYTPGMGSCGVTNSESDSIVALAADMMAAANPSGGNPNNNPLCGASITISYGGKTATATIQDTCPGCAHGGLDLTPSLFQQFADLAEGRVSGVQWWYN